MFVEQSEEQIMRRKKGLGQKVDFFKKRRGTNGRRTKTKQKTGGGNNLVGWRGKAKKPHTQKIYGLN